MTEENSMPATVVAVVGMALRVPGARTPEGFWQNLRNGTESITRFTDDELLAVGVAPEQLARPGTVAAFGALDDVAGFDARFFGFAPREAQLLDPQHRLLLECAWEALEHAGCPSDASDAVIGVYAGVGDSSYLHNNLLPNGDLVSRIGSYQTSLGNDKDFAPTRISYLLDLRGPSVSVQTACSTSLVAVHTAYQALLAGECDIALAGGATVNVLQDRGYQYEQGGVLSPDGHCRAFDAGAAGAVPGNGAGIVVLKRLADALTDGDVIHAVIRGSAINNDGSRKVGFTAPSVDGQADVIAEALDLAEVDPATVSYVEAHGTGTALGDPIEIAALTSAFGGPDRGTDSGVDSGTDSAGRCAIGSVKTNIGHLDTAAGVIGVIKTVLAMKARELPPSLHFTEPNPELGLDDGPFHVNAALAPWHGDLLRAGVSSFGIGGTNAHVVLEEAPARTAAAADAGRHRHVLPLSAATPTALRAAATELAAHLRANPDERLGDVAYTLQRGRWTLPYRCFVVAGGIDEATEALGTVGVLGGPVPTRHAVDQAAKDRDVVFTFPGQGAQRVRMGHALYAHEPVFRAAIDHAAEVLRPCLGADLRDLLYPTDAVTGTEDARINRTEYAQPALFAVEYALAQLWMSWGVRPVAMLGHSLGELVAACVAGVLSPEDALRLVAARGRLMQGAADGAMLAVPLSEAELTPLLGDGPAMAAVNGPRECVVSGPIEEIAAFEARLAERATTSKRLTTSHAFHSAMMDDAAAAFEAEVARVRLAPPRIPFVSNVTGEWITTAQATSPAYWARQLRSTVRFDDGLRTVRGGGALLLEVGPGQVLTGLARARTGGDGLGAIASLPSTARDRDAGSDVLAAVGELWCQGARLGWESLHGEPRPRRTVLPTYPFERERYWIEPPRGVAGPVGALDDPTVHAAPLPAADRAGGEHAPDHDDDTERDVAAVFSDLLGVTPIAPTTSFFELGGHSLLATQLVAQLGRTFGVELPLRTFVDEPTIRGVANAVHVLRAADGASPVEVLPTIVADPASSHLPFPLTDVQQAYWVGRAGIFELGNVGMHGYEEFDIPDLDLPRMERAFRRLIQRHGMLRAIVLPHGEQQILTDVPDYVIATEDVRGRPGHDVDATLERTRAAMSHQVFVPDRWPLFELRATVMDGGRTRLHYSMDGLITDAWASNIVTRELVHLYLHPDIALPGLELSFRDYVLAERSLASTEPYRRAERYWQERIPDLAPAPELPLARDPRTIDAPRFHRVAGTLPAEHWARVKGWAASRGITPTALLLTVYSEVLATWSKNRRFTLNLPMANRLPLHPEVDAIIGDFTSVTLLEIDAASEVPFAARACAVRDRLLTDLDHKFFSGVRVMREMKKVRGDSAAAMPVVFTSLFLDHGEDLQLGEIVYSISQTPQIWIDAQVYEADDGALTLDIDAVEGLFPDGLVTAMNAACIELLRWLAADEARWGHPVPSLVPGSDLAIRREYNRTAGSVPPGLLHEPFFATAARAPARHAVITPSRVLTYGELAARANGIAARLGQLEVRPNELVAVVMAKGWEQCAAVLGILAAGAAYLPIDPELPDERIRFLLAHGEVRAVLTQSHLAAAGASRFGEVDTVLGVDELAPATPTDPDARPSPAGPDDLAYVIFTSGSTGLPKGVMIDHRGALNTVVDVNERFGVGPADRVLALSSLSFDLSVYDIFGPLAVGGTVVVPDADTQHDPAAWLDLVRTAGVTIWNSVPALMELLVEHLSVNEATSTLRLVLLSGDWIPVTLPERIRRALGAPEVISLGGATEASIWSILHPIGEVPAGWTSIPYGRPMKNQTFHVLDDALRPRPVGVAGQLYIGGIGLAKGYLRDRAKTDAGFVVHPATGERLYRTGDLGRFLPGGDIEFLGREDFQVKVQGYRIELGEIEVTLMQHPGVRAAVVVIQGDPRGAKRLVAFVVPQAAHEMPTDVREFLRTKLPAYMVPELYLEIDALPLTANGKVDRRALVVPGEVVDEAAAQYQAPRTPIEEAVAEVWSAMLKVDRVSVHDNFFLLGGDSLLAMRAVVHLRKALDLEIPVRVLFDSETLEDTALVIEEQLIAEIADLSDDEAQTLLSS